MLLEVVVAGSLCADIQGSGIFHAQPSAAARPSLALTHHHPGGSDLHLPTQIINSTGHGLCLDFAQAEHRVGALKITAVTRNSFM